MFSGTDAVGKRDVIFLKIWKMFFSDELKSAWYVSSGNLDQWAVAQIIMGICFFCFCIYLFTVSTATAVWGSIR